MYAGVGSQGAEDAWYAVATHKGHMDLLKTPYTGGTVDISKWFDQINRELVRQLASDAGMDHGVLSAYVRYQEGLLVHNSVARGIGKGFLRRTGIPQGCPLLMLCIALLRRPWLMMQEKEGHMGKTLADDIYLMTFGKCIIPFCSAALRATHIYLVDMGGIVSPTNNFNFASTAEAR